MDLTPREQPVSIQHRLYEMRDWAGAPHIYLLALPLVTIPVTLYLLRNTDLCHPGATSSYPAWTLLPGLLNLATVVMVFHRNTLVRTHAAQATVLGFLRFAFPFVNHNLAWGTNTLLWLASFYFIREAQWGRAHPRLVWASAIGGALLLIGLYFFLPTPDFWWECWENP